MAISNVRLSHELGSVFAPGEALEVSFDYDLTGKSPIWAQGVTEDGKCSAVAQASQVAGRGSVDKAVIMFGAKATVRVTSIRFFGKDNALQGSNEFIYPLDQPFTWDNTLPPVKREPPPQPKDTTQDIVGKAPPDFDIDLLDGSKTTLSHFLELKKPIVIDFYANFWAGCGPAADELNRLAEEEPFKHAITFLLLNKGGREDAQAYKDERGLTSPSLVHGAVEIPSGFGLRFIPHKVLIGKDGIVIKNKHDIDLQKDLSALL